MTGKFIRPPEIFPVTLFILPIDRSVYPHHIWIVWALGSPRIRLHSPPAVRSHLYRDTTTIPRVLTDGNDPHAPPFFIFSRLNRNPNFLNFYLIRFYYETFHKNVFKTYKSCGSTIWTLDSAVTRTHRVRFNYCSYIFICFFK